MVISLAACGKQTDLNKNTSNNSKPVVNSESTEPSNEIDNERTNSSKNDEKKAIEKQTKSVYVIRSFYAVQGAVIYDTSYDEYGYPCACRFHKKCEACGYVSNENGYARGNLHSSYHCIKCGNNQQWEIKADGEWIEVDE